MKDCEKLSYPTLSKNEKELEDLLEKLTFSEHDSVSRKLSCVRTFIEENIRIFHDSCAHVDIVTGILDYLNLYTQLAYNAFPKTGHKAMYFDLKHDLLFLAKLFYTLYFMSGEKLLLEIFSKIDSKERILDELPATFETVIIVFEDADLYSVVDSVLMNKEQKHINISRIWVQESLDAIYRSMLEKSTECEISYFRSVQEITNLHTPEIASIWSENILLAKNLAESMKASLVFINASEEICREIPLPNIRIPYKTLDVSCKFEPLPEMEKYSDPSEQSEIINHNVFLYYNGTWNAPINHSYFGDRTNHWANAAWDDVSECVKSAKNGFKQWSSYSADRRKAILRKYMDNLIRLNILKREDEPDLLSWLETSPFLNNSLSRTKDDRIEILAMKRPVGVVVLTGQSEELFVHGLIQALSFGNGVIVLPDMSVVKYFTKYISALQYCGLPPGAANFLSSYDVRDILNGLIQEDEISAIFEYESMQENLDLTLSSQKYVLLPVK